MTWLVSHKPSRASRTSSIGKFNPAAADVHHKSLGSCAAATRKRQNRARAETLTNKAHLAKHGFLSRIHVKKPKGKPMSVQTRIANARKSKVRPAVEDVFAHEKGIMGWVVRTIGIAPASVKIGLANLAYNMRRFVWIEGRSAPMTAE